MICDNPFIMWNEAQTVGSEGPVYFGPLAPYDRTDYERKTSRYDKSFGQKSTRVKEIHEAFSAIVSQTGNAQSGSANTGSAQQEPKEQQQQEIAINIPTWDDFTQTTTLHGVRYIFEQTHFKLRRYT